MRVNIAQATPPSLSPPPSPHNASPSSLFTFQKLRLHRSPSCLLTSSTLPRSKSTDQNLRRSCSASFDGHDFPHHHPIEDFTRKQNTHKLNFPSFRGNMSTTTTSFRHSDSQVDVLEPSLLGIKPDPPDWPARDAMIRECIAKRASSIELPVSLRMIKMKQKFLKMEEEREILDLEEHMTDGQPSINSLCCSTLYIVKEIQSQALKSRGMLLDEELDDGIVSKVQREMTSSFIWLFREVFAKTPDLMLQVMVLTSNFATHSLETLKPLEQTHEKLREKDEDLGQNSINWGVGCLELGNSGVPTKEIMEKMEENEVGLWNSMVEEANHIEQGGCVKDNEVEFGDFVKHLEDKLREKKTEFVSPVKVEIEGDDYEEYHRTDLLYQMGLFHDPNNTLLLSNYAQFLCLVSQDYDRAEECFKRAIQLDSTDAEVMIQYANFLWVVRKDLWGAEERFQQAMAAEPDNSFYASKYASFLWSTGGDDTCYPLDSPTGKS
ncbi:uncharacterized protein LOC130803025 isoform X2 [Amaranthus tricolor]|uniref:uncharacterized protein LOC130803025 isoform X2 n=1 Tax=Amaranthus tricolor TaxID=29722 RepID=UPI002585BD29|nr:uncharacterized protein LOC130803025 isoform X2 [Amaranthus tricolor]